MHCTVAQVGELRTGRTVINQLFTVVRLHRRARLALMSKTYVRNRRHRRSSVLGFGPVWSGPAFAKTPDRLIHVLRQEGALQ